jgi:hypothetical protein
MASLLNFKKNGVLNVFYQKTVHAEVYRTGSSGFLTEWKGWEESGLIGNRFPGSLLCGPFRFFGAGPAGKAGLG